jgi:hypothetical protein
MKTINVSGTVTLTYSVFVEVDDNFDPSNLELLKKEVEDNLQEEHLGWDYDSQRDLFVGDYEECEEEAA